MLTPPPLRRSPLFWGGLLLIVFLLFAWGASLNHRATLVRVLALDREYALSSQHSRIGYDSLLTEATVYPITRVPVWAWEFEKMGSGFHFGGLFPAPRWSASDEVQKGPLYATGEQEFYQVHTDTLRLPYWLLLLIVVPLWLLGLRRSRRRFLQATAPPAGSSPLVASP